LAVVVAVDIKALGWNKFKGSERVLSLCETARPRDPVVSKGLTWPCLR
jgi:hypothetical protein